MVLAAALILALAGIVFLLVVFVFGGDSDSTPEAEVTLPPPGVTVEATVIPPTPEVGDPTATVTARAGVNIRTGPGVEYGYDDDGMAKGMALLGQLKADEMISDGRDAIAYLRGREDVRGDRIGAMGFCIGGHMTYLTACETDVSAAASFYGGGIAGPEGPGGAPATLTRTSGVRGRILCLFGEQDALIPSDQVDAIRAALKEADTDHDVVVYPGADHGFFCDRRATFQKEAADDAWERVKALFADKLHG